MEHPEQNRDSTIAVFSGFFIAL